MKNLKRIVAVLIVVIIMLASFAFSKTANATIVWRDTGIIVEKEVMQKFGSNYIETVLKSGYTESVDGFGEFEMNAKELLEIYVLNGSNKNPSLNGRKVSKQGHQYNNKIPVYFYGKEGIKKLDGCWSDGVVDSRDASEFLTLEYPGFSASEYKLGNYKEITLDMSNWQEHANDIKRSLADYLNISTDKVSVKVNVTCPAYEGYSNQSISYEITEKTSSDDEQLKQKIDKVITVNQMVAAHEKNIENIKINKDYQSFQEYMVVTATANEATYYLYFDTDNNFYLVNPKEKEADPVKKFETTLDYKSTSEGKVVEGKKSSDGSTYLPPYYTNEDKDAKKDADAIAIITSKTNEEIVRVDGVKMNEDGTPNRDGWYYPDTKNLKVIEKKYPFDTYNNPKDNGAVKETVELEGRFGGTDKQTPSIEWTLRRIKYDEKKNDDGSVTITITYNLPIEESSIPEGWAPIKDSDGGIRKITRTFKNGESYDKDVIVEQNGPSKRTVTTPVKVVAEKLPAQIPQTGVFGAVIAIVIAGVSVFMVTRYRKLNK